VPAFPAGAASPDAGASETGETSSADALARRVVEATGDPTAVDKLAFTFVVEVDAEQKAKRRHVWKPKAGTLEVRSGETTVRLEELHEHDLSPIVDAPEKHAETWNDVAPEADPATAAKAWSWFINDSYWLLAPAKLMDPGVNRALDDQGRLVLTFGEVGLTPGDRYALTIDQENDRVTKWHYELESGREGTFRWTDYARFGPLELSTRRVSKGGGPKTVIRFEKVDVR
jgi:hypothetical protein